ncbi:hypothetical protein CH366_00980 [Leptospira harrisiae]|uniref:Uncharacterized protein n=1 Tax=Leptospira harrisiae TaxID=2023189 RepID=A0A2N0AKQ4_9LEPT|nr:hypothetical protein CH364_00980 [Leptospira harrisiae]PKA08389.1 hypothetical protein CH366_00980 [Leptospira harrisiae]
MSFLKLGSGDKLNKFQTELAPGIAVEIEAKAEIGTESPVVTEKNDSFRRDSRRPKNKHNA